VASRLAFALDLRGPVMVVGTHCSSSPVAIDAACGALTPGGCDMAPAKPESDRDEKSRLSVGCADRAVPVKRVGQPIGCNDRPWPADSGALIPCTTWRDAIGPHVDMVPEA